MTDQNNSGGGDPSQQAPAPALTMEQINTTINQAVTSQTKRLAKDMQEAFDKRLIEEIAKVRPAAPVDDTSSGKKASPELAAVEQKLQDMQKLFTEQQTRADAAERKQREDRAYNELRSHLDQTVRPELKDVASRDLFYAQKRISFDPETGEALFKIKRSQGQGLPEEEIDLPLADGVQAWLKTKEAAAFVPAPSAGTAPAGHIRGARVPSGYGPGGAPKYDKPATTDDEKIRRANERAQWLTSQLNKT